MNDVKELNEIISNLNHQTITMKVQIEKMQHTLNGLQTYNEKRCKHLNVTHELEDGEHQRTHTCQDCGKTR